MIEWIKKEYITIILGSLLAIFALVRVTTLHKEIATGAPQSASSSMPAEVANNPLSTPDKSVLEGKTGSCVGPGCSYNTQTNLQSSPVPQKIVELPAMAVPTVETKQKACEARSNSDCMELAELKESQGDKAAALKLYLMACRPPEIDIHACGDAGRLMSPDQEDQASKECKNGQLHMCLPVAGYHYERGNRTQAKEWYSYGCTKGLTESCFNLGYLMSDDEIKAAKEKCNQGSAAECLYVAGKGSSEENLSQDAEYVLKACELGDQTSCLRGADAVPEDKVDALKKECLAEGKLKACLLSIGRNSDETTPVGKDPALQKQLIKKACELGSTTACANLEK